MAYTKIVEENDINFLYTVKDQDGSAVNLTSATIKWSIRRTKDSTAALEKSTSSGITITSAANGQFTVAVTDADTVDLGGVEDGDANEYIMEAVITDSAGKVYTITGDDMEYDILAIRERFTEAT